MRPIQLTVATMLLGAVALLTDEAAAQPRLGGGFAYGTEIEELGLQLNGYYGLDQVLPGLRVGADFIYYFTPDPVSLWTLDLNGQYRFIEPGQPFGAYAIAGLEIARASFEAFGVEGSNTEVGLDLGIGGEYAVVPNVELFGEFKYVIIEGDQAVLTIGARYLFP
jgi:outer membrane immunogenic protein